MRNPATSWAELRIEEDWTGAQKKQARRLNSLGSLFCFEYETLGYTRMTRKLHGEFICKPLESEKLALVNEFPRVHFKTTCATIGLAMWWALPFTEEDEKAMRELGYGDEWIRWMKIAHNTCTRTLIASETTPNAFKMGEKIANHYELNERFRNLFEEIIPTGKERWGKSSRIHNRLNDGIYQSEGTYDFIGAEAALQSNHYTRIILDDVIGEDAIKSHLVMQTTKDWFGKLHGCFDSIPGKPDELGDQVVNGNRWGKNDLNSHIRKTESRYTVLSHSAEGGCCEAHPAGVPIFPEEFSMKKLRTIRGETQDSIYIYSCHYLNNPTAPGATRFNKDWLRWYDRSVWEQGNLTPQNTANYSQLSRDMRRMTIDQLDAKSGAPARGLRMAMHHEVKGGEVIQDVRAGDLDRVMIIDALRDGEYGRTGNAILVLGIYNFKGEPRRIYFLDGWCKATSHEEWIDAAIGERGHEPGLAWKWKVHRLYAAFESAEQQGWMHTLKEKLKLRSVATQFTKHNLDIERVESAKHQNIIGMESIYQSGAWWMPRFGEGYKIFVEEYNDYPHGASIDLLDLAGYSPQTFGMGSRSETRRAMFNEQERRRQQIKTLGPAGY